MDRLFLYAVNQLEITHLLYDVKSLGNVNIYHIVTQDTFSTSRSSTAAN